MTTAIQNNVPNIGAGAKTKNAFRDVLVGFGWLCSAVLGVVLPLCLIGTFTDNEKYSTLIVLALNFLMLPGVVLFLRANFLKKHANSIFLAIYGFINPMGWGLLLLKNVDK